MIFRTGPYVIDAEKRELTRNGEEIGLQPQAFALLVYLVENCARVVSKNEIFDQVWQGRIVGDGTLNSRINAVRRALGDDGASQKVIRTLPRQGYRFVADVEQLDRDKPGGEPSPNQSPSKVASEAQRQAGPAVQPTVAVLPFKNLSGDPEQEYFADGIAEDILTALGRFGWFFVVARSSSFSFKGQSPDVRLIGRELGAHYVVDGTVRKVGDRVRISVELVDASTGHLFFAEQYDRDLTNIFDLQDEIAQQVAMTIVPTIELAETERISTKAPNSLAAWETCLRGSALVYKMNFEDVLEARRLFSQAIELEPSYSRAHSGKALTYSVGLRFFDEKDRESGLRNFATEAGQAVELDPGDAKARILKALAHMYQSTPNTDLAIKEAREAVALNPHDPQASSVLGVALAFSADRIDEGVPWIEKAVRTSRRDPLHHLYLSQLAIAQVCGGRYEVAAEIAQEAVRQMEGFIESHIALAAAYGYLGKRSEAKQAIKRFADQSTGFVKNHLVFSENVKSKLIEGLERSTPAN